MTVIDAGRAERFAREVVAEAWDVPDAVADSTRTRCDGLVPWHDAEAIVAPYAAIDPVPPESGEVEVWTVHFDDPECVVNLLVDAAGKLAGAGVMDPSDLGG